MKRPRIYADTSVFGGAFDSEFRASSEEFFEEIRKGRFSLVTSAVVQAEIDPAPQQVKELFEEMLAVAELIDITEDAILLRDAYLEAKIVSANYSDDALHVALAIVSECSLIRKLELPTHRPSSRRSRYTTLSVHCTVTKGSLSSPH